MLYAYALPLRLRINCTFAESGHFTSRVQALSRVFSSHYCLKGPVA